MKYQFTFILIFFMHFLNAQDYEKLFYSENKDRCFGLAQLNENLLVFARNKNTGPQVVTSIIEKNASLVLYDTNSKTRIKEFHIDENEDVSFFRFLINDSINQNIIALGGYFKNSSKYLIVYRFDYELNVLKKSTFQLDYEAMVNALLNTDNNLVVLGMRDNVISNKSFLFECSPELGLINYQSLQNYNLYVPSTLFLMNDKYYVYDFTFRWHVLNSDFSVDTVFFAAKEFKPIYKAYTLNNKTYMGALHFSLKEYVYSINTLNQQDTFYSKDFSQYATSSNAGFYSLDGNKDGFLFFSNTIGGGNPNNNTSVSKNYISMHKIDTLGNTIWEYYIGGDSATYFSEHVLATKDGGCLLVFDRFNLENEFGNEDVYYIKFDKDGNVEENFLENISDYTPIKNLPKPQAFLIYPNPADENLNIISSVIKDKYISIYSNLGQHIQTKKLSNSINLSDLQQGNYFYSIINEKQEKLQEGKFLKK